MEDKITVSLQFMNQQRERAKEAAHYLTSPGPIAREEAHALQILAELCWALSNPLFADSKLRKQHDQQQQFEVDHSFENKADNL